MDIYSILFVMEPDMEMITIPNKQLIRTQNIYIFHIPYLRNNSENITMNLCLLQK